MLWWSIAGFYSVIPRCSVEREHVEWCDATLVPFSKKSDCLCVITGESSGPGIAQALSYSTSTEDLLSHMSYLTLTVIIASTIIARMPAQVQ